MPGNPDANVVQCSPLSFLPLIDSIPFSRNIADVLTETAHLEPGAYDYVIPPFTPPTLTCDGEYLPTMPGSPLSDTCFSDASPDPIPSLSLPEPRQSYVPIVSRLPINDVMFTDTSSSASIPALSLPEPLIPPFKSSQKQRDKRRSHVNRAKKRKENRDRPQYISDAERQRHVRTEEHISAAIDTSDIPVAETGYLGLLGSDFRKKEYALHEVVGSNSRFKMTLVPYTKSGGVPIVDSVGRVVGVHSGIPNDPQWPEVSKEATRVLESVGPQLRVDKKYWDHRRGKFKAYPHGIVHGNGRLTPGNLVEDPINAALMAIILSNWAFQRIAGFTDRVFATWAPRLYAFYQEYLIRLLYWYPWLVRNFENSVWACASFNFGPRTRCYVHVDYANLPFGWCCITALGSFDHTTGGHLILWDFGLVLEFPAGSSILIPSAIIRHSNIAVGRNETWYSFAQYTAGALFRWVDQGFQPTESWWASLSREEREHAAAETARRWTAGVSLYSTLEELRSSSL